jgi:hypothetical protein
MTVINIQQLKNYCCRRSSRSACGADSGLRAEVEQLLIEEENVSAADFALHQIPTRPLAHGTRLGPYEILTAIGAGAMGRVSIERRYWAERAGPTASRLASTARPYCALALLFHLSALASVATTIIAVALPDGLWIAADGRVAATHGPEFGPGEKNTRCKIMRTRGNKFFGIAGRVVSDDETGFDIYCVVESLMNSTNGNIEERMIMAAGAVTDEMNRELSHIARTSTKEYLSMLDYPALGVLFAGWENGEPVVIVYEWFLEPSGNLRAPTRHLYGGRHNGENTAIIGYKEAIEDYRFRHLDWQQKMPVGDTLKMFIQLEMNSSFAIIRKQVGPPISVLRIDATGPHWIDRGECLDIPVEATEKKHRK